MSEVGGGVGIHFDWCIRPEDLGSWFVKLDGMGVLLILGLGWCYKSTVFDVPQIPCRTLGVQFALKAPWLLDWFMLSYRLQSMEELDKFSRMRGEVFWVHDVFLCLIPFSLWEDILLRVEVPLRSVCEEQLLVLFIRFLLHSWLILACWLKPLREA